MGLFRGFDNIQMIYALESMMGMAANIRAVGVENALISTDVGQPQNPDPIETMRSYVQILLNEGFTPAEVKTMLQDNPASFIYE
jgi:hypothetical protein